jgi:ketosteroid isomerase-like protein
MSQQNVETFRRVVEAWNRHDPELAVSYMAPDVEWAPAGPAAVERSVYRGHEECARGFASVFETWEEFRFDEVEVRDLGDSVLWLGRVRMRGKASRLELDQEFAHHATIAAGEVVRADAFLSWQEALEAAGLAE